MRPGSAGSSSGSGDQERSPGRRLTLSPIGFDIVLALSQVPRGMRLADLAHVISSPVSSVQTALRILVGNGLVERLGDDPPRYRLATDHPARTELASLATVLPEPERAIGIIVRANPAVAYAGVDDVGFVISTIEGDPAALNALDHHLELVAGARKDSPVLLRLTEAEFRRLAKVALGLRERIGNAVVLKGSPGLAARSAGRATS